MFFLLVTCLVLGAFGKVPLGPTVPGEEVHYPDDFGPQLANNRVFDIVVVGGGPGGCTAAARLAEDPKVRVLLLEAGGDPPPVSDIPPGGQVGLDHRWFITSTNSSTSCLGYKNGKCLYVPGRVLGGSSTVNSMMNSRGNHEDLNEWAALGNPGWAFKDVLPYFKKSENYIAHEIQEPGRPGRNDTVSSFYHRRGGPLTISQQPIEPKSHPLRSAILKAAIANGLKFNLDVNGADQMGITNIPTLTDALHYRQNTAKVFLQDPPKNLFVAKYAVVNKVLFQNRTAIGVQVYYPVRNLAGPLPVPLNVYARRQVILSMGPFNSPAALERSGIGQRSVLQRAGVKVLVERPGVGENLQDHYISLGSAFTVDWNTQTATHPISIGLTSLTAFHNLSYPSSSIPDVQYILGLLTPTLTASIGVTDAITEQIRLANVDKGVIFFSPVQLRQGKTGSIHINQSADPRANPILVNNQLTTPVDSEVYIQGTRQIRAIMAHPAIARFGPKPLILRECSQYPFNSRSEILCGVRQLAYSLYHVSGTCAMGDRANPKSVVDSRLRVIGVENLRVIDSSIMPKVTRGNTETPTVMIGEKGADLVKEDLRLQGFEKRDSILETLLNKFLYGSFDY